jgi:two-component system copper resistance phosphate regulon response regulator CusR
MTFVQWFEYESEHLPCAHESAPQKLTGYGSPNRRRAMRVLVVEDKPKTAAYLKKGLEESGFTPSVAENGSDGISRALANEHDIILLDVGLPASDGWTVLSALRSAGRTTPVIFVTARDTVPDRVKGLHLGADDYLVKPFAFSELLARMHCVLRRGCGRASESLEVADLRLDLISRKATRSERRIDLTAKEFALLSLLMRHTGEVLSRTVIAEQVWDMHFDSDTNVIDVAIRRLRGKVDDGFWCKLIHSVRGMGYVLEQR